MLRLNFLAAALCMAVLASCTPAEPEGTASADSLRRQSAALTTTITVPFSGDGRTCLNCRDGGGFKCVENNVNSTQPNTYIEASFSDPVPGGLVTGIKAVVHGRLLRADANTKTVFVKLNTQDIGTGSSGTKRDCTATATCEAGWQTSYNLSTGITAYLPGSNQNKVRIGVAGQNSSGNGVTPSEYCVSHVELTITYQGRKIELIEPSIPAGGSVNFGNQKNDTTSGPLQITIKNTGDLPVRRISPSVSSSGGTFVFTLPEGKSDPFDLLVNETMEVPVTFKPVAGGGPASGTLSFVSNEIGFPAGKPTLNIPLSGTGVASAVDTSPVPLSIISFPPTSVDTTSTIAHKVTVRNVSGTATSFNITSATVGAGQPFEVTPTLQLGSSPFAVAAGTSGKEFEVRFKPKEEGENQSGTLTITTDDPIRDKIEFSLSGTGEKPTITLDKTALTFNPQRVDSTSVGQVVKVGNSGNAQLSVTSVTVEGPFAVSPKAAFTLNPGDPLVPFTVTYTPTAAESQAGRLIFNTNDPRNRTAIVSLSGTGVKSTITLDKAALTFDPQRVGDTSAGQVVKVGNSGSAPLNVTSVTVTGPFAVSPKEQFSVDPGAPLVPFTVTYTPTAVGAQVGQLIFNTDDPNNRTATVSLSGTGMKSTMVLTPTTLTFDPQRVGNSSDFQKVTVSNTGTELLDVTAVSIDPPFELFSNSRFTVAPGGIATHELLVRFTPTEERANQSRFLTFTTNEPGKTTVNLPVSGSGVLPKLVVSHNDTTTPLDFNEQRVDTTSQPLTVTLSNVTGTGPIRITSISIGADQPFTVSPTDSITLANGTSMPLLVRFRPTKLGVASGTLTITTDYGPLETITVALSGMGVRPTLQVSPTTEIDFGMVSVGGSSAPRFVKLSNIGTGTLSIKSLQVTSPFRLSSTQPSSFDLKGTEEKTLEVTFHPTVQGEVRGTITFSTNESDSSTYTVPLVGSGEVLLTVPSSSTNPINVGDVRVKTTADQQVAFENKGSGSITIRKVLSSTNDRFSLEGLPVDLGPGARSTTVKVKFSPNATGVVSGIITVESNATNSPHTLYVTGKGTESRVQLALPEKPDQQITALDFGPVEITKTGQKLVRIKNVGDATLDLQSATIKLADGGTSTAFEYRGQPSIVGIPPDGGFVDVPVTFKPTENAIYDGADLILTTNATTNPANDPVRLPLLGSGVSAQISLSPSGLVFAPQRVGTTSPPQTVYITNAGRAELRVEGFTFTNNDFTVSSPATLPSPQAPLIVQPEGRAAIEVTFTPTKREKLPQASMTILSNAVGSAPSLKLDGTGIDGVSSVDPPANDFLRVEVGFSSTRVPFKVRNTGDAPLKLESATIQNPSEENPFIISGFNAGVTLMPNSTDVHEFFVTFKPLVNGYQSATLVLKTDSALNPRHNVTLVGTGDGAEVELIPPTLGFAKANVGDSNTGSLSIKNKGVRTLKIYGISFEGKTASDGGTAGPGNMASDFSVGRNADGSSIFTLSLEPQDVIPVNFKFSPTAVGFREARGVINSNAKVVKFDASGQATSPVLSVEPANKKLEIAGVLLGKTSTGQIRITNTGDGPVTLGSVTLSQTGALFSLAQTPGSIVLAPNASTTLFVTFSPTVEQPFGSAQLMAVPTSSYVPQVLVEIIGVGVRDPVSVESELDFGQHLVGSTSLARTLHVSNNTDSSITLTGLSFVGTDCPQFRPATLPTSVPLVRNVAFPLRVTFRPRAEGDVNCVMKISFAQVPEMQIPLRGKGIPSVLSVSPSALDFGALRAATGMRETPITLLNLSSDPITLAPPEVRYTNGEPFIFDWDSLGGMVLNPGEPIIRKVKYQPAVETFSDTTVFFGTTSPTTSVGVELKLKGRATKRILNANVTSLDFGRLETNKPAQTKTITITNKSPQPQRVVVALKPVEGSPFALKTSGLDEALPPEGTATISVTFDPDEAGEAEDEVQIRLQGIADPELQIPVTGTGNKITGRGSGCSCGTTEAGSAGMLMLLALVGLGSRRRRRG